jgi:hypothetical protein
VCLHEAATEAKPAGGGVSVRTGGDDARPVPRHGEVTLRAPHPRTPAPPCRGEKGVAERHAYSQMTGI